MDLTLRLGHPPWRDQRYREGDTFTIPTIGGCINVEVTVGETTVLPNGNTVTPVVRYEPLIERDRVRILEEHDDWRCGAEMHYRSPYDENDPVINHGACPGRVTNGKCQAPWHTVYFPQPFEHISVDEAANMWTDEDLRRDALIRISKLYPDRERQARTAQRIAKEALK